MKLSPGTSWQNWALSIIVGTEALVVAAGSVVDKDARVAELGTLEICAEIGVVSTNAE